MNDGWISLHRKVWENPRSGDPEWLSIWVYLLCMATHKSRTAKFCGNIITLKTGQLVTSRKRISRDTGVSESKTQRVLKCLESEQQIEQQKSSTSRLITILNYTQYQRGEQPNEQQMNSERTASEQRVNTYNNVITNNGIKDNNIAQSQDQKKQAVTWTEQNGWDVPENDMERLREAYPACDIDLQMRKADIWLRANPAKSKKKQWLRFLQNWLARSQESGGDIRSNKQSQKPNPPGFDEYIQKHRDEQEQHGF